MMLEKFCQPLKLAKIIFFIFLFLLSVCPKSVFAQNYDSKDVVIVNPVRGKDFWNLSQNPLDTPKEQLKILNEKGFPATWLLRFDALNDKEISSFFKNLPPNQETGLFFEITPTLTASAGVAYNQSSSWHQAQSLFLLGYSREDREKLINTAFEKFKTEFGFYPKSVGAWWIDAFSLEFMREKYGVQANLDVADQNSTDGYQVWGQYWSVPYYPSKLNAIIPAQSIGEKIGIVTVQWATRDPYNGYGKGTYESTFSVQPNDYLLHNLDSSYFEKLLDIYPQTTIGLENDFEWSKYGREYQKQIDIISEKEKNNQLEVATMTDFASSYQQMYPTITPSILISADDPLESGGRVVWYQTPRYRVGWFYDPNFGSVIRDLRQYDYGTENCYNEACKKLDMAASVVNSLDNAMFNTRWVVDEGKISKISVKQNNGVIEITYYNESNNQREIKFLENDIEINGQKQSIAGAISTAKDSVYKNIKPDKQLPSQDLLKQKVNFQNLIINFLKFAIFCLVFFLLPGFIFSKHYYLAIPIGIATFTLTAFIFGIFKFDIFLWALPLVSFLFILHKKRFKKIVIPKVNLEIISFSGLIILGSFTWLLTVIKSGLLYGYGLGFWGPNGHDGIWHLALISELQKNIPPQNPIFTGEKLSNYHYFFDLLVAKTSSLFRIDTLDLFFRFFPILISVTLGIVVAKLVYELTKNKIASFFSVFFLYFGGSFGWLISFFKDKTFGGESMFWSQQSISTLLNPPYAISLLLFFVGLFLLVKILQKPKLNSIIGLLLVWGTLIEFKVYIAVLLLFGLGFISFYQFIFDKKTLLLKIFLACLILTLIIFLPYNMKSTNLLEVKPFWLVNSMIEMSDRLGWEKLAVARQNYLIKEDSIKLLIVELIGFSIFFIGNLGTRLIAFINTKSIFLVKKEIVIFLSVVFAAGLIIPLIFIQRGNGWNIVQFFYYSQVILSIFAGISLASIFKYSKYISIPTLTIVVLLTIPTSIFNLSQYIPSKPPAKVSTAEIEALEFLKGKENGIVFTLPYDEKVKTNFSEPLPIYAYTSTSYVSAFSQKPVFIEDYINLEILGVDYKGRLADQKDFVKYQYRSKEILEKNNIKYIYMPNALGFEISEDKLGFTKIFENDEVKIYEYI